MEGFTSIKAVAAPLASANIDTDQIIPARFLDRTREEIGDVLFRELRFKENDQERPDFVSNQPAFRIARILVALQNFGCGSSREAAVWALDHYGFKVVIAPSFGDIFYSNSFKNFLLPVVLPQARVEVLLQALASSPGAEVEVDLVNQKISGPGGFKEAFDIDPFLKDSLLTGRDELAMTLSYLDRIEAFEATSATA